MNDMNGMDKHGFPPEGYARKGSVKDHELLGDKTSVDHEETGHIGELTEEERVRSDDAALLGTPSGDTSACKQSRFKSLTLMPGHREET